MMAETVRVLEISTLDGKMVNVPITSRSTVADVVVAVVKQLQPTCALQLLSDQVVLRDIKAVIPTDVDSLTCVFLSRLSLSLGPYEDATEIDRRAIAMWKRIDSESLEMQPRMSSHLLRSHRLADWHDLGEYTPEYGDDMAEPSDLGAYRVFSFTLIDGADLQFRMIAVIYDNGGGLDGNVYLRPQFQIGQILPIAAISPIDESDWNESSWEVLDDTWYTPPVQEMQACNGERAREMQVGGHCADTPLKVHLAHAISFGFW